jgi:hypothetical protein
MPRNGKHAATKTLSDSAEEDSVASDESDTADLHDPQDKIDAEHARVYEEYRAQDTAEYRQGDNKRGYDREWFNDMSYLFTKLDTILQNKKYAQKIREQAQNETLMIPYTGTDYMKPSETVSKISSMIEQAMAHENNSCATKLLQLQDEVASKRIQYLENEHNKLHRIVTELFEFTMTIPHRTDRDIHKCENNLLLEIQILRSRIKDNESEHNITVNETTRNYTEIHRLKKQVETLIQKVEAPKPKKNIFKKMGLATHAPDASALPALLERL